MQPLDPDALDGIWPPTPHAAPAKDARPGVASVRMFGDEEDEITDEIRVVEHGEGYHAAHVPAEAPPPLTLTLPEPPPPLAGGPHRTRALFNGILGGVLLGGLLFWWAGDDSQEPVVVQADATAPATDQVVEEISLVPAEAVLTDAGEVPLEPAEAAVGEEQDVALAPATAEEDPIGALIEQTAQPVVEEVVVEEAATAVVEEPVEAVVEEAAEAVVEEVPLQPAIADRSDFVPPPDLRRHADFPGTFEVDGHLATIEDVEAWGTLIKALKASEGVISLVGHTDQEGEHPTDRDNAWLRADAVRALLVTQGFNRDRIAVLGAGTSRPVSSNSTAEGRSKNRRVQVLYTQAQTD